MNSTAVLSCFKAGASMGDLASALGVDRTLVEQMVREALDFGGATAVPRSATPRTATRTSPIDAGREPREKGGGRRRSAAQIHEALLNALEQHGPQSIGALLSATSTSPSVALRQLRILEKAGRVRQEGRTWAISQVRRGQARSSAA